MKDFYKMNETDKVYIFYNMLLDSVLLDDIFPLYCERWLHRISEPKQQGQREAVFSSAKTKVRHYPIVMIVELKKSISGRDEPQLLCQMAAAMNGNITRRTPIPFVFGVLTDLDNWVFYKVSRVNYTSAQLKIQKKPPIHWIEFADPTAAEFMTEGMPIFEILCGMFAEATSFCDVLKPDATIPFYSGKPLTEWTTIDVVDFLHGEGSPFSSNLKSRHLNGLAIFKLITTDRNIGLSYFENFIAFSEFEKVVLQYNNGNGSSVGKF
eukprot:TRINITY_DN6906_c0_g1_i2.p1 TRINITY_DN6906_c0_g1~~TRINITY_DN6906_c0_g1_i2.p1  ORF type:complete len:285 (+),score=42.10 TRINITY_DN6906_c0_g1_i2:60-857(+)